MPLTVKRLGHLSLLLAATGFVATEILLRRGVVSSDFFRVLSGGFEAGTIGALADWYAVTALFRRVPIPFLARHSNIIVNNRDRIIANVSQTVEEEWLTPEVIAQHLEGISVVRTATDYLSHPDRREQVIGFLRDAASRILREMDRPEAAEFLESLARSQLRDLDLSRPLGAIARDLLARNEHAGLWDALARGAQAHLSSPDLRLALQNMLRSALHAYIPAFLAHLERPELAAWLEQTLKSHLASADLGPALAPWIRRAIRDGAHWQLLDPLLSSVRHQVLHDPVISRQMYRLLDEAIADYRHQNPITGFFASWFLQRESAIDSARQALASAIEEIRTRPSSDVRRRLDSLLADFADRLASADPALRSALLELRDQALHSPEWPRIIGGLLAWVRRNLREEADSDSGIIRLIDFPALADAAASTLVSLARDLAADPAHPLRRILEGSLRSFASRLADGDPQASSLLRRIQSQLADDPGLRDALRSLLSRARSTLLDELRDPAGRLPRILESFLSRLLADLSADRDAEARLDSWIRSTLRDLISQHHHMIGQMVRTSMESLSPEEMVRNIEQKIGDDLQFIRLNGAVVGFLVGLLLTGLRLAL